MQEQDEQRESENTNLVREMDQIREDNEQLRNTLQLQQQENERLKVCQEFTPETESQSCIVKVKA